MFAWQTALAERWQRLKRWRRWVASGLRIEPGIRHEAAGGLRQGPVVEEDRSKLADAKARATRREVVDLAWPIAIAMLGDTAMGLVDTKLVATLGPAALGGVGVATTLMWLCYSIVFGLMRGVKVRTAHAVGEGRPGDGLAYAQAGVLLAVVLGSLVWLLGRDATWAFQALGIDPSTIPYARDFLAARTWGAVSIAIVSALVQLSQGLGDARTPMLAGLVANVLNAILAWALIHGRLGLPALGVRGAGFGTAIAETVQAAFLAVLILRARRGTPGTVLSKRRALHEVLALGGPTGLQFGTEMLALTAFTAVLGGLGAHEIAAHQIALSVIRTSFLPGVAVSEAASVLVGKALGERDLGKADRVTRTSLALAVGFMTVCGVLFATAGSHIAAAFTSDAAVVRVATKLLLVAAVFQALDAVAIVLRGALRGAKDVRATAAIGITVIWICVPGSAWWFGRQLGWGALGGWLGFVLETSIGSALYWWRWTRGAWRADYPAPIAEPPPSVRTAVA